MRFFAQIVPSIFLIILSAADQPVTRLAVKKTYTPGSSTYISTEISTFVGLAYDSMMFVDKSMLIKEFIESEEKIFLITCPRRWGKSVNLNMLKVFFEVRATDQGEVIPRERTYNYILFMKGEVYEKDRERKYLTKPLLIAQHPLFCDEHLGQYPVLYIEFDYTGLENTFKSIVEGLRVGISNAYAEHKYIINKFQYDINYRENITDDEREIMRIRFHRAFDIIYYPDNVTPFDILASVISLSELLHHFFDRKIIILIDEYHLFWEHIVMSNWTLEGEKEAFLEFYVKFISHTFTNNTYYEKAIITGVYPPPVTYYYAFLNQTVQCNLLTGRLMEYYGFSESVIREFYDILDIPRDTRDKVDRWYGGYTFDNSSLHLYNPWSIANFFSEDEFDTYWVKEENVRLLIDNCLQIDAFRNTFQQLLRGKTVKMNIDPLNITWSEMEVIHKFLRFQHAHIEYTGIQLRKFWTVLYIRGYISATKISAYIQNTNSICTIKFPNDEIRLSMKRYLNEYYEVILALDFMHPSLAETMRREFHKFIRDPDEDSDGLRKAIETYLDQDKSIFHTLTENLRKCDKILSDMITYLLIDDRGADLEGKLDHVVQHEKSNFPVATVVFRDAVAIIDVKFNKSSVIEVLNISKAHPYPIFASVRNTDISAMKFIGINILANKTVEIAFELQYKKDLLSSKVTLST